MRDRGGNEAALPEGRKTYFPQRKLADGNGCSVHSEAGAPRVDRPVAGKFPIPRAGRQRRAPDKDMMGQLQKPVSKKTAATLLAVIVCAGVVSWAGWTLYGKMTGRPPSTAQVKRSVWKFLGKQAPGKKFAPALDVSSASLAAAPSVTTFTNKAGKVKTVNKANKIGKLGLPETSLSASFRTNQTQAASYEEMFRLIGEQLTVAEQLLAGPELEQQWTGLIMASEASTYARTNALNPWLGARICEGWLWPNLALVETTNNPPLTPDALLNLCDIAFKEAGETNHIIRNYEYLIAKTTRPNQADAARFRLSRLYEDAGEDAKALAMLKQIKTSKNGKLEKFITALEEKVAATRH